MLGRATLVSAALLLSATAASASTLTYSFNTGTPGGTSIVKTFEPDGSETTPGLTITSKTVSDDGTVLSSIPSGTGNGMTYWSGNGLGLQNSSGDNSHTVDGYGLNDLLLLQFTSDVKVTSATFGYVGLETNGLDGFAFFADGNTGGVQNGFGAGDMVFSSNTIGSDNVYNFTLDDLFADIFSKTFAFAAIFDETKQVCEEWKKRRDGSKECKKYKTIKFFDSFKLKSITVELPPVSAVPVPGALPLFLSALAMGGYMARRKARKAA